MMTPRRCPRRSPLALVFGNELVGVDVDVVAACERTVSVPMLGVKNSLNVATCASILMWEALRQWGLGRTTDGPPTVTYSSPDGTSSQ